MGSSAALRIEKSPSFPIEKARSYRHFDVAAWICYCIVVAFSVVHHEPWADEAEAWLMSRDLTLGRLLCSEMRYEGSPGLWHTFLWALTRLHLPYEALNWVSASAAMSGAAYLIFRAPFPRLIRYGLAGSYWIVYQYAVIARPYVFIPLLAFAAAELSSHAQEKTFSFLAVLLLLSFTSVHGVLIALAFATSHVLRLLPYWKLLDMETRRRQLSAGAILACSFLLIAAELYPPKDLMVPSTGPSLSRAYEAFNGALLDWIPGSLVLALIFGVWTWRRRNFSVFVLGLLGLTGVYALIHGWPHHIGIALVMIIATLWQSWPDGLEIARFSVQDRFCYRSTITGLICVIILNGCYSVVAIYHEYRRPYSGARQAAICLEAVVSKGRTVYGFDYGMNSVLAYFDHNIFANLIELNGGASFFHHSAPYVISDRESFLKFRETHPDYLLFICWRTQQEQDIRALAATNGYVLDRVFPGRTIVKASFDVYQTYLLYRRRDLPGGISPAWDEGTMSLAQK